MTHLDAVLWDLDGTLIDSEPYWMAAEQRLVDEYGIAWSTEDALALVGIDLWEGARIFMDRGVPLAPDAIVERLTNEVLDGLRESIPFRPGARELLAALLEEGVPTALVTMSTRSVVTLITESLERELGRPAFAVTVAGDEVTLGKPHAEPYATALSALGARPEASVGIEDSMPGSASALAAGLVTIGVPHAVDISGVPGIVHWPTLESKTPADVRAVVEAAR